LIGNQCNSLSVDVTLSCGPHADHLPAEQLHKRRQRSRPVTQTFSKKIKAGTAYFTLWPTSTFDLGVNFIACREKMMRGVLTLKHLMTDVIDLLHQKFIENMHTRAINAMGHIGLAISDRQGSDYHCEHVNKYRLYSGIGSSSKCCAD